MKKIFQGFLRKNKKKVFAAIAALIVTGLGAFVAIPEESKAALIQAIISILEAFL